MIYLNCHSWFSFRYGTIAPSELVEIAVRQGAKVLALTDINNTSAIFDFISSCAQKGIQPIVGIEFRDNQHKLLYTGLAKNNAGFRELNEFLSAHRTARLPLPATAPAFNNAYIIYPYTGISRKLRDNEWIGVRCSDLKKLSIRHHAQDRLIMFQPVTFQNKTGYNVHRLLRCIDQAILLSRLTGSMHAQEDEVFYHSTELLNSYKDFPAIISNTWKLAQNCSIHTDNQSKNRETYTGNAAEDRILLEKLALEGLSARYGVKNRTARERVIKELEIIDKLNYNAYFLITWDIIRFAITQDFAYVGRGSGANSIVAYCLRITDVDPVELDLYFERFLNPHRTSPPDFDIDFSWKDRDTVFQHILDTYGFEHCALLATYNTFSKRSACRELAKVFGLPKAEIDILTNKRLPETQKKQDHITRLVYRYAELLNGFPNHLSVHASGILISEAPIATCTGIDLSAKGFPITHFDMFTAENIGYHKYDILSQRGLGHIKNTLEIVRENTGETVHIDTQKALTDPLVREHIKKADTIGCFYIESPGMRMLLHKLQCEDYQTLVAASSIIRPGVAQSGMMQEYIYRYHHPDQIAHLHPRLGILLKDTFGIMVYQEDVIKVAHLFAGLDPGEADILRRAMSGKFRGDSELAALEQRFLASCKDKGYSESVSREVWRQIKSFSGYSFSKAHSASYAIESYHSLYLKAHYPLAFMVAVINNFGGFYNTEFYIQEARKAGAIIEAPCINNSMNETCLKDRHIYIGFAHVKALEEKTIISIIKNRENNGTYKSLYDFLNRVSVSYEQLTILIRMNAFRFCGKNKKALLWEAGFSFSQSRDNALFKLPEKNYGLPALDLHPLDNAYDEIDLLGFPLCFPFELLSPERRCTGVTAQEMILHTNNYISVTGYLICTKYSNTIHKESMAFGHFLDREGNTIDTIHFPPQLRKAPFQGQGFYLLTGKVTTEFNFPCLEVSHMKKLPMQTPNLQTA